MTRFFSASDGAQIAYLDQAATQSPSTSAQGAGPSPLTPILCLSGLTRTKEDFDAAMPSLSGRRVIRMDYRGRGESDFTGAQTYSVHQEAMDALALLDHLNISQAAILGTSRGGLIGMYLARAAHDRLAGLCLVDIGPHIEMAGLDKIRNYVGQNPRGVKTHQQMAVVLQNFSPGFDNVAPGQWLAMAQRLWNETPDGLTIRYDPALGDRFRTEFGQIEDQWDDWSATQDKPVALIRGANTDLLSPTTVNYMRMARPDMIFSDVPDRAHVPFLDEPSATATLALWLKALP